MKFTKRKTWILGDWDDNHWTRQAVADTIRDISGTAYNHVRDLHFRTRELADEFAFTVLRRLHAEGNVTVPDRGIADARDRTLAIEEITPFRRSGSDLYERRCVGEPRFTHDEHGSPTLTLEVEVRVGGTVRTTRTVTVDGEEFTRTVEDRVWSSWYRGHPVQVTLSVWPHETVEVQPPDTKD